ncbi:unnamed protein product [Leptosia nina]|uniref:Uncharacterized protein n=1 Tax=Leptosia nina TaxID=320188 RepID=A0AAV1IU53_9NEOP
MKRYGSEKDAFIACCELNCECEHRRLTSLVWWSCSVAVWEVLGEPWRCDLFPWMFSCVHILEFSMDV